MPDNLFIWSFLSLLHLNVQLPVEVSILVFMYRKLKYYSLQNEIHPTYTY